MKRSQSSTVDQSTSTSKTPKLKQEISKLEQEGLKLTDLQQQQLRDKEKQLREEVKQLTEEVKQLRDEKRLSNTYCFKYRNDIPYEVSYQDKRTLSIIQSKFMLWHNGHVLKTLTDVTSSSDNPIIQLPCCIWVKLDYERAAFMPLIFDTIDSFCGEVIGCLVVTHKDQDVHPNELMSSFVTKVSEDYPLCICNVKKCVELAPVWRPRNCSLKVGG